MLSFLNLQASDPVVGGLSSSDVVLANNTGLVVSRFSIDGHNYDSLFGKGRDKALLTISPQKHDLEVSFVGGAIVRWPHFDFAGKHELFFERDKNKIQVRFE